MHRCLDLAHGMHGLPAEDRDVALTLQPISETQMVLIAAGMIDWQTLKTKKHAHLGGEICIDLSMSDLH